MDKSLKDSKSFFNEAKDTFDLNEPDIMGYSGLQLAYIGDGVFELAVRTIIACNKNTQVQKMHKAASEIVKAKTQADMIQAVFDNLTKEEQSVCRRGKNSKPYTKAKNASIEDYLWATGLEALCGWLYLKDEQERLMQIIKMGLLAVDIKI